MLSKPLSRAHLQMFHTVPRCTKLLQRTLKHNMHLQTFSIHCSIIKQLSIVIYCSASAAPFKCQLRRPPSQTLHLSLPCSHHKRSPRFVFAVQWTPRLVSFCNPQLSFTHSTHDSKPRIAIVQVLSSDAHLTKSH